MPPNQYFLTVEEWSASWGFSVFFQFFQFFFGFFREISYIVDSMSGFGAYPVDLEAGNVSYIVSSANKNIEVAIYIQIDELFNENDGFCIFKMVNLVSKMMDFNNANVQGVPGFAFGLCRKEKLVRFKIKNDDLILQ